MTFDRRERGLAAALIFLVTVVAMEAMAVLPIMPVVEHDLGGLEWYGWVFAGFQLTQILAIPITGRWVDRANPATPLVVGILAFTGGLLVASLSTSMPMLVGGRLLQGFGAGVVPSVAYVCVGRGFAEDERPRVFALMSTAWIVPAVAGPAAASFVTSHASWRWVFGGLIPFTIVAGGLAIPAVREVGRATVPSEHHDGDSPFVPSVVLVVGAAGVISASQFHHPVLMALIAGVGIVLTVLAFRRLTPSGTLLLRGDVAAAVGLRGLLTAAFFATDAFVSLTLEKVRGTGTTYSAVVLAAAAFTWTGGSWIQARAAKRIGPRVFVRTGLLTIAVGVSFFVILVRTSAPTWIAVVAWLIGGLGIGLAYTPLSLVTLARAEPGREGFATAALQLSDVLGIALGTGLAGAVVATADRWNRGVSAGVEVVFWASIVIAVFGAIAALRLPARVSDAGVGAGGDAGAGDDTGTGDGAPAVDSLATL